MKEIIIETLICLIPFLIITEIVFNKVLNQFKNRLDKIEIRVNEEKYERVCNRERIKELDKCCFDESMKLGNLEYKITEPKYLELMEYLDNYKGDVDDYFDKKDGIVYRGYEIKCLGVYHRKHYHINDFKVYFKDKQIILHQDQIQSLFDKAESYYKAKELMEVKHKANVCGKVKNIKVTKEEPDFKYKGVNEDGTIQDKFLNYWKELEKGIEQAKKDENENDYFGKAYLQCLLDFKKRAKKFMKDNNINNKKEN